MALQLTKTYENGFSGNYWKVLKIEYSTLNQSSVIHLALYKDLDTRSTYPDYPYRVVQIELSSEDFPFAVEAQNPLDSNVLVLAYAKIKTMNLEGLDFSTAVNV